MRSRHFFLLTLLGSALLAFAWFMVDTLDASPMAIVAFVFVYFGAALLMLKRVARLPAERASPLSVWTASYAVGGGLLLALGVMSLPFAGYAGFELMGTRWFPALLIGSTLAAYPFVRRRLRTGGSNNAQGSRER